MIFLEYLVLGIVIGIFISEIREVKINFSKLPKIKWPL